jgi:uncharacterized protein
MIAQGTSTLKKSELQEKDLKTLKNVALSLGIKRPSATKKADLISEILAAQKVKKISTIRRAPKKTAVETKKKPSSAKKITAKKATKTEEPVAPKTPSIAPTVTITAPESSGQVEHKFETPVHPAPTHFGSPYDDLGELPESYGTGRLFFVARDPYWIYAYWDYTWQQLEDIRRAARYGELKLRVHAGRDPGNTIQEMTLNPSSKSWFIKVDSANADYCAEFGFYDHSGNWRVTSRSYPTHTPPDKVSDRTEARFVTIPFHISFRELYAMVKDYFNDGEELADVLFRLQAAGFKFPFDYEGRSDSDEDIFYKLFGKDLYRRIRMGSEVISDWLKHRILEETSSGLFSPSSPMGSSFSPAPERGFWFNVNAELIVYGATDPKAKVTFDGKEIALKPDGTFRFQFALPDGNYGIPIAATAPDNLETRQVALHFVRDTANKGDVGVVDHPPELQPPTRSTPDAPISPEKKLAKAV